MQIGSQNFINVSVPLLWDTRAVLQDHEGRISVVNLERDPARLEILGDRPAEGVEFIPTGDDSYKIMQGDQEVYEYDVLRKCLIPITLELPECEIRPDRIRIGTNTFSGNTVIGSGVGIIVRSDGMAMGAPLPPGLARLVLPEE